MRTIPGTFREYSEIASKMYDAMAKNELEKQLNNWASESSPEVLKELELPRVLLFLSSTVAKSNKHRIIESSDVEEANAFLRYILSRDMVEKLIVNDSLNIGLPQSEQLAGRLNDLTQVPVALKVRNHLGNKINRLETFLKDQKLKSKHITKIMNEIQATTRLFSLQIAISRSNSRQGITPKDIDIGYDIIRYLIFKLEPAKIKILKELYQIDDTRIWHKIPKVTFDQSAHDHLSNTAYASWENELPESFESLKKYIGCSRRPFLAAILAFCEIYGAKKGFTRISSQELMFILEEFEAFVFGELNPMILEDNGGPKIVFTKEGVKLLSDISRWITTIIVKKFGKDEYVFNYSSTVPRHVSLLLFISIVEKIRDSAQKIDTKQIATATLKWSNQLKVLATTQQ